MKNYDGEVLICARPSCNRMQYFVNIRIKNISTPLRIKLIFNLDKSWIKIFFCACKLASNIFNLVDQLKSFFFYSST